MKEKQLLGKRIKRLRSQLRLTQDALAEQVQISPKYLSNIERGRENPTLDTLLRLARSLKADPWELFFFEQEAMDSKAMLGRISRLLDQVDNQEQLRLVVRLLQAVLH